MINNKLAPIILFIYNRPDHTRRTLEALKENFLAQESSLYIYADGPKPDASDLQKEAIMEARKVASSEKWCKEVTLIESKTNKGLAQSIISGVTDIVSKYDKVIVLEDDIVTSPHFLTYMNDALNMYEHEERLACIHGYVYPVKGKLPDYFFLRGADCWGWATWKRAWKVFNPDAQFLLDEIKRQKLEKLFNFNGSYDYTGMLQDQIDGKVSSWAIRWYASAFLANKYTLYPGASFVENIGMDGTGTHCGTDEKYKTGIAKSYIPLTETIINDCGKARKRFMQYFSCGRKKNNLLFRILRYIRARVRGINV